MKDIDFNHTKVKDQNKLVLLAENNTLQPASGLNYFEEESADFPKKSPLYLKKIVGMSHKEMLELAKLCGVSIMPFDVKLVTPKSKPDDSLKELLLDKLILITLQEAEHLNVDSIGILRILYNKIQKIQLFQCEELRVKYPFEEKETDVIYYFQDLTFHVAGDWQKPKAKFMINDKIKSALNIKTDIREILELKELEDIEDWLKRNRFTFDRYLILKKGLESLNENFVMGIFEEKSESNPDKSIEIEQNLREKKALLMSNVLIDFEDKDISNTDNIIQLKKGNSNCNVQQNTGYDISKIMSTSQTLNFNITRSAQDQHQIESTKYHIETFEDEETLSELKSTSIQSSEYEKLSYVPNNESASTTFNQSDYFPRDASFVPQTRTNYSSCLSVSNKSNEILGRLGEKHVYQYLKNNYADCEESEKIEVVWVNKDYESGRPFDIVLIKNGQPIEFIEVKSTIKKDKCQFELSQNEFLAFQDLKEKYIIYRAFNVNSPLQIRIEILRNPARLLKNDLIRLTPRQYNVEYQPCNQALLSITSD
jgi:hypothetical protein